MNGKGSISLRNLTTPEALRNERGVILIAEFAIGAMLLLLLTSLVAGAIFGIPGKSREVRIEADRMTIAKAAGDFYLATGGTAFPVEDQEAAGPRIRPIFFDAPLPHDETRSFVPDFLKESPISAQAVQWQLDTVTGAVSLLDDTLALAVP